MTTRIAQLITSVTVFLACGCESGEPSKVDAPRERSQAVLAANAPSAPSAGTESAPRPAATPKAAALREGALCKAGTEGALPKESLASVSRRGADFFPESFGRVRPAWINLWAAWCEPCKEELPLLLEWHRALRAKGIEFDLVFVSLDDDDRQLQRFLDGQRDLEGTYVLREGEERRKWLSAFGLPEDPRLPVQLVLRRGGELGCLIDGAILRSDEAAVTAMLRGL